MKPFLMALAIVLMGAAAPQLRATESVASEEAARRVAAGDAVLIDVREPAEWAEGVAEPALLLALSDLRADRRTWAPVLEKNRGKHLILYCRSGKRSAAAAEELAKEGFDVANAGGFSNWRDARLPVRKP